MKDNLMRLLTAVLLILCFGATATIMGQGTDNQFAFAASTTDPHDISATTQAPPVLVNEPPAQIIYATVEHMKVLPGMWDQYLATEKVWKKIHQGRKQRGEIMDWFMFQTTYPNGTNATCDFTTITYQTAKQLASTRDWATMTKGLTKEELTIANDAEKTRNLTDRSLYSFLNGCDQAVCKPGKYLQLFFTNAKTGKGGDYEKFLIDGEPLRLEAIKTGKIQGWSVWERQYPSGPEYDGYTTVYAYESMEGLLKNSPPDFTAELKKTGLAENQSAYLVKMRELREWLGSQVWVQVDATE